MEQRYSVKLFKSGDNTRLLLGSIVYICCLFLILYTFMQKQLYPRISLANEGNVIIECSHYVIHFISYVCMANKKSFKSFTLETASILSKSNGKPL